MIQSGIDNAALKHGSVKVKSFPTPSGRLIFNKGEDGKMHIKINNSPVGYSDIKREEFGIMIQILQAEGKLPESGHILISQLEAM